MLTWVGVRVRVSLPIGALESIPTLTWVRMENGRPRLAANLGWGRAEGEAQS